MLSVIRANDDCDLSFWFSDLSENRAGCASDVLLDAAWSSSRARNNWSNNQYIAGVGQRRGNPMWALKKVTVFLMVRIADNHCLLSFDRRGGKPRIVKGISGNPEATAPP
jgi:hypothetical protein